jgi:hypothetical protein
MTLKVSTYSEMKSCGSAVSIATGCGLDNHGVVVRVLVGSRIFISPCHPYWFWGSSDPPSKELWEGSLSMEARRQGHKADHSPPTSAKVKKTWVYTFNL